MSGLMQPSPPWVEWWILLPTEKQTVPEIVKIFQRLKMGVQTHQLAADPR